MESFNRTLGELFTLPKDPAPHHDLMLEHPSGLWSVLVSEKLVSEYQLRAGDRISVVISLEMKGLPDAAPR